MNIPILGQHPDFVVVDKPAGLSVHSEDGPGLVPQLCEQLGVEQLWLLHRLDKITSGCLLLAKNSAAAAILNEHFAKRQISKFYLALATQKPKKKQGSVSGDMQPSRRGQWKLCPSQENPAISQFFSASIASGLRLFLLRPLTGRTHQLRVMMKSQGCPILGDQLYSGERAQRTYLHAWQLGFDYQGQDYRFSADAELQNWPSADALQQQLAAWSSPEKLPWPNRPGVKG